MANLKVDTISGIGTEGPVLNGGLHFRSKNYLTLPKGTTAERTATSSGISTEIGSIRYNTDSNKMECYVNNKWMIVSTSSPTLDGGARGLYSGRSPSPGAYVNTVDYITISTAGNAIDFGDQNGAGTYGSTTSDKTRGLIAGGHPSHNDVIDFFTISSTGDAIDFGDRTGTNEIDGLSTETRGVFAGGYSAPSLKNTMEYITISSTGAAKDFGDLGVARSDFDGCSSPTRGIFGGGGTTPSAANRGNVIDFITIQTTGNSSDFGDLTQKRSHLDAGSNAVRGIFVQGINTTPSTTPVTTLDYVTIATLGNAKDFGDLATVRRGTGAVASGTRAVFGGGRTPSDVNIIDYVQIATTGNGLDFGDLTNTRSFNNAGMSNGHGGLG